MQSHPSDKRATRQRRHLLRTLFAGVALGSSGHIAAVTIATIVGQELAGGSAWSGAPAAAIVFGSAAGSAMLSALMARRGRRLGLVVGYVTAAIGALAAVLAVVVASLPLLLVATFFLGFGNSASQLARYTAADLFPSQQRASALGTVVWGATIGAVVGPNLVAAASSLAGGIGLPVLAGGYLVTIAFTSLAALLYTITLRPEPYELADQSSRHDRVASVPAGPLRELLRRPRIAAAITALVVGQVVMVLIMTMTPLHLEEHGSGLATVGLVISAHTFGMFALAPVSGWLTDRFGSPAVILGGMATLGLAALLAAGAPADGGLLLTIALFLLGFGWNQGFVAGSAMLTHGLELAERTRLQGLTDAMIWGSAAFASLGSGLVVAAANYAVLGLVGAFLVSIPALMLLAYRGRLVPVERGGPELAA
ncbi:MAG TPA: MFS transporter [Candidatus Limnocylindria bacterium]|nr:MFS transporter [Candidatus Limnocylindria bacterium]